jgi:hypothetical protein
VLRAIETGGRAVVHTHHSDPLFQKSLEDYYFYCDQVVPLLFTENESNTAKLFGTANESAYVKDGVHECLVHGKRDAVNPARVGTKASAYYHKRSRR